ncbi:MAG TPA: hypothetical protein VIR98_03065 [Candidatus Paceibacterota bacterium]|jgi:hypothetical protein
MKKVISWVIGIIIVGIITIFALNSSRGYYPDPEGWNRQSLSKSGLSAFLPITLNNNLYLVSPDEKGVFDGKGPVSIDQAFIEYRENAHIKIGLDASSSVVTTIKALRSFYGLEGYDEMPIFKVWVEQTSPEDFSKYKTSIIEDTLKKYASVASSNTNEAINLEKSTYKNHEYYTYLRKDLSYTGLKGKNSIGGAYMFFPENNTVEYIFLFNTKYNSADAYLITKAQLDSTIHQIIDSVVK